MIWCRVLAAAAGHGRRLAPVTTVLPSVFRRCSIGHAPAAGVREEHKLIFPSLGRQVRVRLREARPDPVMSVLGMLQFRCVNFVMNQKI
jgi:hypothetical protein